MKRPHCAHCATASPDWAIRFSEATEPCSCARSPRGHRAREVSPAHLEPCKDRRSCARRDGKPPRSARRRQATCGAYRVCGLPPRATPRTRAPRTTASRQVASLVSGDDSAGEDPHCTSRGSSSPRSRGQATQGVPSIRARFSSCGIRAEDRLRRRPHSRSENRRAGGATNRYRNRFS